jgi:hypothetical protein
VADGEQREPSMFEITKYRGSHLTASLLHGVHSDLFISQLNSSKAHLSLVFALVFPLTFRSGKVASTRNTVLARE